YQHIIPGLWYPGTGTKSCAASYRWYRDILGKGEMMESEVQGIDAYEWMNREAEKVAPLSDNLYFHPYLQGELTPYFDASLRGSFTGIRAYHTKGHFTRALLEGVAYSLKDCYQVIQAENLDIHQAIVIGGGAKGTLWRQIVSDVLGIEMMKTKNNDSSLGSAMLAGVATGVFGSFEESVAKCVETEAYIKPNMENHKKYEKGFQRYKKIHDALADIYKEMEEDV
ncbi:MAG: xylulokinase, partial [Anaerotignum sp.]|nr:xylulokinase [Anaerotignum sp.]